MQCRTHIYVLNVYNDEMCSYYLCIAVFIYNANPYIKHQTVYGKLNIHFKFEYETVKLQCFQSVINDIVNVAVQQ